MDDAPADTQADAAATDAVISRPKERQANLTERLLVAALYSCTALIAALLARATFPQAWGDMGVAFDRLVPVGIAFGRPDLVPIGLGVLTLLLSPFSNLIHELGHALGARFAGLWLAVIQVNVVRLTRTNTGLRLSLVKPSRWLAGFVSSYPLDGHNLYLRNSLFVLMGPLADLATAVLATEAAHAALGADQPNAIAYFCFYSFIFLGWGGLFFNIVPIKLGRVRSDGWRLLLLITGNRAYQSALVFSVLQGYVACDLFAREYSPAVLARAKALAVKPAELVWAAFLAYAHALDSGNITAAGHLLDEAVAVADPPSQADALAHEVAYYEARFRKRPAEARAWLARGQADQYASFMRPRAQAAIALAEGHYREARDCAAKGLAALQAYSRSSGRQARSEERELRALLADAEHAIGTQSEG
jgi:hypothetical protein